MGNDNEVRKNLIEKTKSVFLPKSFDDPDGKPPLYSLENEFMRTARNRSWKFYLSVFAFLSLVIIAAFSITMFVKERGKNQKVDISSFQDLKLKELIDASQRQESALDIARRELSNIEAEYRDTLQSVRDDYDQRKDIVEARDTPEEEKIKEKGSLDQEMNRRMKEISAGYEGKISKKTAQIELLKKELSKNSAILSKSDSEKVDTIFKENSMLEGMERNSLKSLFENRITSLQEENRRNTEMLIKKYNPQFSEKDLQAMLSETVRTAPKISVLSGLDSDLLNEKSTTNEKINRLRKNVSDSYRINERMEKIPYINSAGRAILHIAARFKDIVATYDQIVVNLVSGLRKKNEQIKYYDYAFNYVIRDEKECGYILDPRNPENMGVFVNRVHNIKPGDMGYVFRQDDEFVGTIKFKKNNGIITAETIQLVKGVKPLPFDRIMLNKIEKNDGGLK